MAANPHEPSRSRLRQVAARIPAADDAIRRLRRTTELEALQAEVHRLRAALEEEKAGRQALEASDRQQRSALTRLEGEVATLRGHLASSADVLRGMQQTAEAAKRRLEHLDAVEARYGPAAELTDAASPVWRYLQWVTPGHFYSPVPDWSAIAADREAIFDRHPALPGVELGVEAQLGLFGELAGLVGDLHLARQAGGEWRYAVENPYLGPGDALVLAGMLRWLRPRRYIEIGSGWSTALALDVSERFLDNSLAVTAIEPNPANLYALLRPGDRVEVLERRVQEVELSLFESLEPNDVVFIDDSHVVKTGSDAQYVVRTLLPHLPAGVYVQIHDVFWPFEYLSHWVEEGRAWNEAYLVHAFLLYNSAFEITLFNDYLATEHREVMAELMPAMLENSGASLWLRRTWH